MAVRQIDRPQRSALGLYPVGQLCCLRVAEKRIDQQRITLTPDEGDRVRNPAQRLLAGRHALGGAAALPDEEFPVKRRVSGNRGFHWCFSLSGMIRDRFRTSSWPGRWRRQASRAEILPGGPSLAGSLGSTGRGVEKPGGEIDKARQLPVGESGF